MQTVFNGEVKIDPMGENFTSRIVKIQTTRNDFGPCKDSIVRIGARHTWNVKNVSNQANPATGEQETHVDLYRATFMRKTVEETEALLEDLRLDGWVVQDIN